MISEGKLKKMMDYLLKNGESATLKAFGISRETLNRHKRSARARGIETADKSAILGKIADNYSSKELEAIAAGGRLIPGMSKVPVVTFEGKRIRIGAITDTHYGSMFSHPEFTYQAFEEFKKSKVDFLVHCGDVTEGMSKRQGHVYELSHIGYDKQKDLSEEILGQWSDTPAYAIDGNHDRWYIQNANIGANIVKNICGKLDNWNYLGHDEGDISLKGKATLKLWHGLDGNAYALSYRLQKILESLSGGEKPHVMICGHTHKYVHIFERMVHCISVGCMQRQTKWMRGKRLSAHVGFATIDIWVNDTGVAKFRNTFYPFYT